MKVRHLLLSLTSLLLWSQVSPAQSYNWTVTQDSWTAANEKKFSEFVEIMGDSGCTSLHKCLTSPSSNPFYANRTPKDKRFLSDCADLPFALRAYFAWMEGLPFDFVDTVAPDEQNSGSSDIRYTRYGNKPKNFRRMTKGNTYNAYTELTRIVNTVSTATYRMHHRHISDFYPTKLDPKNIKAGTVLYDASGHAAIIYKIESDGRIRMMDAHPDQSITRILFSQKFARSRAEHGAGFKNWRPEGDFRPTSELPGYSLEIHNQSFSLNGTSLNYYDYIRAQMSGGNLNFNPVEEIKSMMTEVCDNVRDRIPSVAAAVQNGIAAKNHPSHLPSNIYGTDGEWESYSTPSRDARLKTGFVELKTEIQRFVEMYAQGNSRISYTPTRTRYSEANCANNDKTCYLAASLLEAYEEVEHSPACQFSYVKSNGQTQRLSYQQITDRLFYMSFDPYHCPELRWGAISGDEFSTCRDSRNKLDWYNAQQGLRNQIERTYDAFMGYDLNGTAQNLGVRAAPDVNLKSYLIEQLL